MSSEISREGLGVETGIFATGLGVGGRVSSWISFSAGLGVGGRVSGATGFAVGFAVGLTVGDLVVGSGVGGGVQLSELSQSLPGYIIAQHSSKVSNIVVPDSAPVAGAFLHPSQTPCHHLRPSQLVGAGVVGDPLGEFVGFLDGDAEGLRVGLAVGFFDGEADGFWLGDAEGLRVGLAVGFFDGEAVGEGVGLVEGERLGLEVEGCREVGRC